MQPTVAPLNATLGAKITNIDLQTKFENRFSSYDSGISDFRIFISF